MPTYDALIIGTGQAGPYVAHRMAKAGMKVAVVERKLFGGTCVNTGCIPTKTMIASAYAAQLARRGAEYGFDAGQVRVNMARVKARKDEISGKSRSGVESGLRGLDNCTVYQGHARFVSPHEVQIGDERITAERIFINVGGRAAVPKMPGIDSISFLTNTSVLDLDVVPEHLVVIGGSYIGLEFGQAFRRFGSEVTIVEMADRVISREDEDVSQTIAEILQAEGIHLRVNAKCIGFANDNGRPLVKLDCSSGPPEITGSHVLLAVGRRPNTDDLGLDRAGVHVDERGYIAVDDRLETNVRGVWALGDCNGKGAFTHTSYNDAEIVVGNLLEQDSRKVSDRIVTYGLFIDPPLGRAGMTDAEVKRSGRKALTAKRPMTKVGRAVEKGESQGFMKVIVDAETKEILGAAVLGPGGDEAVHSILDVMYARKPYSVIQRAVHIHPTVTELIPTLLGDLKPM